MGEWSQMKIKMKEEHVQLPRIPIIAAAVNLQTSILAKTPAAVIISGADGLVTFYHQVLPSPFLEHPTSRRRLIFVFGCTSSH